MGCFSLFKSKPRGSKESERPRAGVRAAAKISSSSVEKIPLDNSPYGKKTSNLSGLAPSPRSIPIIFEEKCGDLRVFELSELRSATNDFSRELLIGEGGFGNVYKGFVRTVAVEGRGDRVTVAVKVLNQKGWQGHKQWLAEVQFLGVLRHPNLVKLLGCCSEDGENDEIQRLLVYEYMPNKSLDDHLFNKAYPVLPWNLRLKIALGAAEGLAHLHEGLEIQIIHRDFKASNILLDNEFTPKLSDFGLAREGPTEDRTHVSTVVLGTRGYAAPDYVETGHLTTKSDVWSFGVVLYELLTGRRPLEKSRPANEQKLLEWVQQFPIESKRFNMIMDPRLKYQYSLKAAREVAKLANRCLAKRAKERPKISEVVDILKLAVHVTEATRNGGSISGHGVGRLEKGKGSEP
ncbi:probable serine/threonine-protein kinase PBL19 [Phalaenopsis equestris]|uniref:probable serine/threonine-protein kinase PBL19 n=1 Tax=Phalaenopsis equestris TaxID=78828 RepID=UPI0009E464CC|nr:probable serine/threonine-protein kinase PBL19 [Phalaenopsis equestris]